MHALPVGLPPGSGMVSVVWEKGSKLSYTDPAPVDEGDNSSARFSQVMRQVRRAAAAQRRCCTRVQQPRQSSCRPQQDAAASAQPAAPPLSNNAATRAPFAVCDHLQAGQHPAAKGVCVQGAGHPQRRRRRRARAAVVVVVRRDAAQDGRARQAQPGAVLQPRQLVCSDRGGAAAAAAGRAAAERARGVAAALQGARPARQRRRQHDRLQQPRELRQQRQLGGGGGAGGRCGVARAGWRAGSQHAAARACLSAWQGARAVHTLCMRPCASSSSVTRCITLAAACDAPTLPTLHPASSRRGPHHECRSGPPSRLCSSTCAARVSHPHASRHGAAAAARRWRPQQRRRGRSSACACRPGREPRRRQQQQPVTCVLAAAARQPAAGVGLAPAPAHHQHAQQGDGPHSGG